MKIITKEGKSRNDNIQFIIVNKNDKYGVAMIAYFKNSLNGKNVNKLEIKDKSQVQLFYNRITENYTLQILRFSIERDCIIQNYNNFKEKYDVLIQDKISHI